MRTPVDCRGLGDGVVDNVTFGFTRNAIAWNTCFFCPCYTSRWSSSAMYQQGTDTHSSTRCRSIVLPSTLETLTSYDAGRCLLLSCSRTRYPCDFTAITFCQRFPVHSDLHHTRILLYVCTLEHCCPKAHSLLQPDDLDDLTPMQ